MAAVLAGSPGGVQADFFGRALKDLDVDRRARDAGVQDQPSQHTSAPDANEREFVSYFSSKARERRGQCEGELAQHALDRTATAAKIDVHQTRSALSSLYNSIEPDLARKRQDHMQDLESAKDAEARALRYLRHFQLEHGLKDRAASPRPSLVWHFSLVCAFAVIEWVALSVFYAEGSDFGLLGGVLMAAALSLVNIVLAVVAGVVAHNINHRHTLRKLGGVFAVFALTVLFLFATAFAAQYRNAVQEIAAQQTQVSPSTFLEQMKAGAPMPAADDQWRASKLAWEQFRRDLFFNDVISWLLVILALVFGVIAFWKGYRVDDPYPGYGQVARKYEQAKAAYEHERKRYTDAVDATFTKAGRNQQELLRAVRRDIEYFQDLARRSETEVARFGHQARELAEACSNIVFRYRDLNRQVATSPAPAYFREPAMLDAELLTPPAALTEREQQQLAEYSAALREFTEIVEKDDARRQSLRAQELGKLDDFFARIERAIDEKLSREAALYRT